MKFIVINSTVVHHPGEVRAEYNRQLDWLEAELVSARDGSAERVIVLSHHPLFLEHPDEPDLYFNVPRDNRRPVTELLQAHSVDAVFRRPHAPEQLRPARQHADDRLGLSRLPAGQRSLRLPDGHGRPGCPTKASITGTTLLIPDRNDDMPHPTSTP